MLCHRHFQHALFILDLHFVVVEDIDVCDDWYFVIIKTDAGTSVFYEKTDVEYIFNGLRKTVWIDDEFKKINRGIPT